MKRQPHRRRPVQSANRMAAARARGGPPARFGATFLAAAAFVAIGLVVFANSFAIPFIYDDQAAILDNPHIRQLSLSRALAMSPPSAAAGRPLVGFSLAINYAIGGLTPWGYHAWNLCVHLLAALLLFGILRRTLVSEKLPPGIRRSADWLAFAAALIWLVHPLQTELVNYTTQRTEAMMGLFYLLTLYAAIRAIASPVRSAGWAAVAVAACALGMACKESMVTAPVMVLLYDAVFGAGTLGGAFRRRRRLYIGLAATWIILAALVAPAPRWRSAGFSSGVAPTTYVLNQAVMIVTYLKLAVWPRGLVLDYGPTTPVSLQAVLPYALVVVGLIVATAAAWVKRPPLGYLGTWFFVTLAPSSSIVPIATEVGAERRMYLPLAALAVLGVVGSWMLLQRLTQNRPGRLYPVAGSLLTGAICVLAVLSVQRNSEYQSADRIWQTVLERRPHGRAHYNLGLILKEAGRREEAIAHYREAVRETPQAHYALGFELDADGRYDEAIAHFQEYIRRDPDDINIPQAHILLGRALTRRDRLAEANRAFRRVVRMWPNSPDARAGLADVLLKQERFAEAAREYHHVLRQTPDDAAAHFNLGVVLVQQNRDAEAIVEFEKAVALSPGPNTYLGLGNALLAAGRTDEAIARYRQGIALAPDNVPLHNVLATALAVEGKVAEAIAEFERSLSLEPDNPLTRADYAALLRGIGRVADAKRLESQRSVR